jgi:hypothetical protein
VRDRHVKFHEDRDNLLVVGGVNAYSVERSVSALARLVLDHGLRVDPYLVAALSNRGGPRRQTACDEAWSAPASPRCGHASKRRARHPLPRTGFEPKSQENLILRVIVPYVTGRIP